MCLWLARSLLVHGKAREAKLWQGRAEALGGGPATQHTRLLLDLVAGSVETQKIRMGLLSGFAVVAVALFLLI